MATLTPTDSLTSVEVAKRQGSRELRTIVEALSETNEILQDAPMIEASDGTIQNTVVRTVQPGGTKRLYNEGISAHASQTKVVADYIMMLEDYSDVDRNVADHAPSKQALLEGEDMAFLEGMGQTQADSIIYGNRASDPADINGFHVRYGTLAANSVIQPTTPNATASQSTSIWIVKWAPGKAHLFYPRGRGADLGIKREFRGLVDAVKVANAIVPCYRTFFSTHFGMAIPDARAVKRVANIKTYATSGDPSGEELAKAIMRAMNQLPVGSGTVCIYANAGTLGALDEYALTKTNVVYTKDDPWGRPVRMFREARLRRCDAILNTEAILT